MTRALSVGPRRGSRASGSSLSNSPATEAAGSTSHWRVVGGRDLDQGRGDMQERQCR